MTETTVLDVGGLHWATSAPIIETTLQRRPGVVAVHANAANQTATVIYEPARTSVAQLTQWVRDCGFHCSGRAVPDHVCDPMADGHRPAVPRRRLRSSRTKDMRRPDTPRRT